MLTLSETVVEWLILFDTPALNPSDTFRPKELDCDRFCDTELDLDIDSLLDIPLLQPSEELIPLELVMELLTFVDQLCPLELPCPCDQPSLVPLEWDVPKVSVEVTP